MLEVAGGFFIFIIGMAWFNRPAATPETGSTLLRTETMKTSLPRTTAAQRALSAFHSSQAIIERLSSDLLFLENWESNPPPGTAAALRIGQIRRANPRLAAEIRQELLCECRPRRTS